MIGGEITAGACVFRTETNSSDPTSSLIYKGVNLDNLHEDL